MNALLYFAITCGFIIVYHHVMYPSILRLLSRRSSGATMTSFAATGAQSMGTQPLATQAPHSQSRADLPTIELILPAYNEADVIAAKLHNIAGLNYPKDKLKVSLWGDGCRDDTIAIARSVILQPALVELNIDIVECKENQGKIAILNQAIGRSQADIVALSDISALISSDGLLIAAQTFTDPHIGVVNSSYHFAHYSSAGEQRYWQYQSQLKKMESATGSVIGAHGALYFFRRSLFSPLASDTINDDFILPMKIVAQGYRAVHQEAIRATELECVATTANNHRRQRIGAGNLQQVVRLRHLLSPAFKGVAFNFLSGKVLRVFMPLFLIMFFVTSWLLASTYMVFLTIAVGQTLFYGLAYYQHHLLQRDPLKQPHLTDQSPDKTNKIGPRVLAISYYFAAGYWHSFIGMTRYLTKSQSFRV